MATVKEIKALLDAKGISYHKDDRKHELESLLMMPEAPEVPVERPRNIKAVAPAYINPAADFIDPNSNPATQAD